MSSDNGYIIRKNSNGKFVLQHYFASEDTLPDIADPRAIAFSSLEKAIERYHFVTAGFACEYGLRIDINYPTISNHERYVDNAIERFRNPTNTEKDNHIMQNAVVTQKFIRRPFEIEAIEVSPENIRDVAVWAGGEVKTDPNTEKEYIKVDVHRPLNDRQTKAFAGDWVLYAPTGFKVYTPKAFKQSFEQSSPDPVVHVEPAKVEEKESRPKPGDFRKGKIRTLGARELPKPGTVVTTGLIDSQTFNDSAQV